MSIPPLCLVAIRQPAFLYDANGRVAEANEPAEALAGRPLTGYSPVDVINAFDIRSPDETPLLRPTCRRYGRSWARRWSIFRS